MKGTTETPAARVCGKLASALVPSLGRELASTAFTQLARMRALLAVPSFFVVMQMRIKQRAGVVGRTGRSKKCYKNNSW